MSYDGSRGYLASAQAAIRFCLTPETFPVFLAWVREEHGVAEPEEFFDPDLIRTDLTVIRDILQPAEEALIAAGFRFG